MIGFRKPPLIFLLIWVCQLWSCTDVKEVPLGQNDFVVRTRDGSFEVGSPSSGDVYFRSASAAEGIQFAVDQLRERGGTVQLSSGNYFLAAPVRLYSRITLSGTGPASRLVVGDQNSNGTAILVSGADQAVISSLSVIGHPESKSLDAGIIVENSGGVQIAAVNASGAFNHGIWLRRNSFICNIRDSYVSGSKRSGIYLDSLREAGRGGDFTPNSISNCVVHNSYYGIEANNAIVVNIDNCTVFQSESHGYYIHSISNSVVLSGCRTYQTGGDGVYVQRSDEINLTGNIFCWHEGHGVVLEKVMWGTITGNNIIDNGSKNLVTEQSDILMPPQRNEFIILPHNGQDVEKKNGILILNSKALSVTGNTIFNWPVCPPMKYGIEEDEQSSFNLIGQNNIDYVEKAGVYSKGQNSLVVNNVSHVGRPHHSPPSDKWQGYDRRLMERFLEKNLQSLN